MICLCVLGVEGGLWYFDSWVLRLFCADPDNLILHHLLISLPYLINSFAMAHFLKIESLKQKKKSHYDLLNIFRARYTKKYKRSVNGGIRQCIVYCNLREK
jgi:hypothetical protein